MKRFFGGFGLFISSLRLIVLKLFDGDVYVYMFLLIVVNRFCVCGVGGVFLWSMLVMCLGCIGDM